MAAWLPDKEKVIIVYVGINSLASDSANRKLKLKSILG